jgi:N-carbamoyl-L-amino-acid hydrolase
VAGHARSRRVGAGLRDAGGRALREVVAEHGVELDRVDGARQAAARACTAYLELHIEQGPVWRREGRCGRGGERHVRRGAPRGSSSTGQASHAGTTPMDIAPRRGPRRRGDRAGRWSAVALRHSGVGTTGLAAPGAGDPHGGRRARPSSWPTCATRGRPLAAEMLEEARATARRGRRPRTAARWSESEMWRIEPIPFDAGSSPPRARPRGPGARWPAGRCTTPARWRATCPAAMMFTSSTAGLSHAKEEDTPEARPRARRSTRSYGSRSTWREAAGGRLARDQAVA